MNIYPPYTASGSSASQKPTKREVCRVYTSGMGVLKMLGRLRGSGEGWGEGCRARVRARAGLGLGLGVREWDERLDDALTLTRAPAPARALALALALSLTARTRPRRRSARRVWRPCAGDRGRRDSPCGWLGIGFGIGLAIGMGFGLGFGFGIGIGFGFGWGECALRMVVPSCCSA